MRRRLFVTELVALEVLTTLRSVYRSQSEAQYDRLLAEFYRDYPNRFNVIDVEKAIMQSAMTLTKAHRDAKARSMDVLHMASALHVQDMVRGGRVTMVSSDLDQLEFARSLGLRTFDPRTEPLAALPRRPA